MKYYESEYLTIIPQLKQTVFNNIYKKIQSVEIEAWVTKEPVSFENRKTGTYLKLEKGDAWGELWDCAWFRFKTEIPSLYENDKLVLLIDINGELCLFDKDTCPVLGLTNKSSAFDEKLGSPGKRVYYLEKGDYSIELWADCACNDLFGNYKGNARIVDADLAVMSEEMNQLYYDIEVLFDLLKILPEASARYRKILASLAKVFRHMKQYNEDEAVVARGILRQELDKKSGDASLSISAIGHAHIDLAWLWPIRETKRKAARTFSTAIKNMDLYKDYIFGASQPQLYEWIKTDYPALYEKIKVKIQEGQWEAQGGMWVEADTNLSGGEALVRQILYGKRYFRDEFGIDIETLWLPDVFGYSAALPQILKKSGIHYFMTIKLSWSTVNQFPHHTFVWQGLDGSKVLAHMPPEGTYNSPASPNAIYEAETKYLDSFACDHTLVLFGIGDGGGGPGEEHLERLKREKNLNGLSPVTQEKSIDFFKKLEKNMDQYKTWVGELYLEKHQGTYTTQSKNKKYNRLMEHMLAKLELISVIANIESNYEYPREELTKIWKEVLLYQFHDILPGSCIKRVYTESLEIYLALMKKADELQNKAFDSIRDSSDESLCLFNSLSWDVVHYTNTDGVWNETLVPALSIVKINKTELIDQNLKYKENKNSIENDLIKICFDPYGAIESIFDKEYSKEVLSGQGNQLAIYQEIGGDNWDFSPLYREMGGETLEIAEEMTIADGPYLIRRHLYKYQGSTIEQDIIITSKSKRIDFKTKLDWQERQKMLRTSFNVNVHANDVSCDIQFGTLTRSNNNNTSWDFAQHEICAHKYVDLSQSDYGVALLNDCKYGYYVKDNVIDLHLVRNNGYPDSETDLCLHEFTYSLYPHINDFHHSDVIKEAYILNRPPVICRGIKPVDSIVLLDNEKIVIESIKMSEDEDAYVVRLYEAFGGENKCKIKFSFPHKNIYICDLMESNISKFDANQPLSFLPFEIITLKIYKNE